MAASSLGFPADQLSLFGSEGGVDLLSLRSRRDSLRGRPRAPSTARSYASDWRSFAGWCELAGRCPLPAEPGTVSLFVTWLLAEEDKRVSTALRHLASVADAHRRAALPVPSMAEAREVCLSVRRRRREQPNRKAALAVEHLVSASKACDVSTVRGLRDRAILVLGFATSLRRSELARLDLADVSFERQGLAVIVRYAKRDQEGRGRLIGVWAGRRACTDPVRVLKAWIAARGRWPGRLFCRVGPDGSVVRKGLRDQAVADVVKAAAARVGLDASLYAGHSLRSGAVTASAILGRSDQEIMRLSGHASAAVMRGYVRGAQLFAGRNPLAGVL